MLIINVNLPSVTKIIAGSKSERQMDLLHRWKMRQIALYGEEQFAINQKERFALGHGFGVIIITIIVKFFLSFFM